MEGLTLLRALSDNTRLKIAKILLSGPRCACELPKMVGKAQPTVSLQLKKLAAAGVVSAKRDGVWSVYSLKSKKAAQILKLLSI